jgi:VWFA-related protein
MVRWCWFVPMFIVVCVSDASPADRISADQLEKLIDSARSNGQTDAQIARSLSNVELAERLPNNRLGSLLSLATGPRTRDVLQILADVSAFVEQPAAPSPSADAPSAEQQKEMLARAREYTLGYITALPDFVTTRVTRRFDDYPAPPNLPEVWHRLRFRDTQIGQLSFNRGVESYQAAADEPEAGLGSYGEFGSMMGNLFIGDSPPQMSWGFWETMGGQRVAVFRYSVAAAHSRYSISHREDRSEPVSATVAYRGELYVDPASGGIWRITLRARDVPPHFPTHWVETMVDYAPVQIGATSYLCPARSSTFSEVTFENTPRGRWTIRHLNEIRFVHYQKFGSESRLVTGEVADGPPSSETCLDAPQPWLEIDPSVLIPTPEPQATAPPVTEAPKTGVTTIRTSIQLVEVPVIVKDKLGVPVTGLKKEDFEVYDNWKRQDVRVFIEERPAGHPRATVPAGVPPTAPHSAPVFSNSREQSESPNHSTVILIDLKNTQWADLAFVRLEILKLLRQLPAGESVGLYVVAGSSFAPLDELGSTPARVVSHLTSGRKIINGPAIHDSVGLLEAWAAAEASSGRVGGDCLNPIKGLTSIAEHLGGVPGRKSLIWVSGGFPSGACADQMTSALRAFNSANVAVYAVDAPGLQTAFADASVQVPIDRMTGARTYSVDFVKAVSRTHTLSIHANQATMQVFAEGTGGRAFLETNDIAGAIHTALDDPGDAYRLGFYHEAVNDGRYHEIRVKVVGRPELRVRYREGYFDEAAPTDKKAVLRNAFASPVEAIGIPLRAELGYNSGKCELKVNVGLAAIALQAEGERWIGKLDVSVMERHDDAGDPGLRSREQVRRLDRTYGLQLKQETYEQMLRDGFPYDYSFKPQPEITSLRVVVHDPGSGAVGSLTIPASACSN